MILPIQLKRGLEAARAALTPKLAEPIFTTDEKELYIGDGTTPGGIPVGTVKPTGTIAKDQIAVFEDATGKVIKGLNKADIIAGLATTADVNTAVSNKVDVGTKVDEAKQADNATTLANKPVTQFLLFDSLTGSYQEDDNTKVVTATGIKNLYDFLVKKIEDGLSSLTTSMQNQIDSLKSRMTKAESDISDVDTKLTQKVTYGAAAPTGGSDGDIYVKV